MPRVTVGELVDYLQRLPQDSEVVQTEDEAPDTDGFVVLDFVFSDLS